MSILKRVTDAADLLYKKEVLNEKPRMVSCPKCKTKVASWAMSEKTCRYCKHKFTA